MDWMTPIGLLIGLASIGYVLLDGNSLGLMFNSHAIILVFGGTLGATLLSYPSQVILQAFRAVRVFLFPQGRPEMACAWS
jgi:chemotaxis protein MotA